MSVADWVIIQFVVYIYYSNLVSYLFVFEFLNSSNLEPDHCVTTTCVRTLRFTLRIQPPLTKTSVQFLFYYLWLGGDWKWLDSFALFTYWLRFKQNYSLRFIYKLARAPLCLTDPLGMEITGLRHYTVVHIK